MKIRKILVSLLVLVLALGIMGIGAAATDYQTLPQKNRETIPVRINPIYEDIYTAQDLAPLLEAAREEAAAESGDVSQQMPTLQIDKSAYLTPEKAALQLRDKMEARQSYIEVYISDPSKDYNTLIAQVVDIALAHTGDPVEGDYLRWHFGGWEGEVEWEESGSDYLYKFSLTMIYYTTAQQEQQMNGAVDSLLGSLSLSGKSDYEKVYAVYDYICDNITYDNLHLYDNAYTLKYSAYAALINKTAVCQGYGTLFYRLMLEMGIDSRLIAGEAGGPHAWNIVKLGDVYYNLDSTWDAGSETWEYFLKNSEGFADHYRYLDYATTQFHADYPMSATDYVDGVTGAPENVYVAGQCGRDAYWTLGHDRVLTIVGTGKTYQFKSSDNLADRPEWEYWEGAYDRVVVEEGITELGEYIFSGAESIVEVTLPTSLHTIGMNAFANCKNLSQITLPEGLVAMGWNAFMNCNFTEITIPSTVATINGFYGNQNLTTVNILAEEVAFGDEAFRACINLTNITIPEKTTFIGRDAFEQCNALQSVTIPASVTSIESDAFRDCQGLKSVVINGNCYIDSGAFYFCKNLEEVVFNGDGDIGSYVFGYCEKLKKVELNGDVQRIGVCAFEYCKSLEKIVIPETVNRLDSGCFRYCPALKEIYFTGDEPYLYGFISSDMTVTCYYPNNNPTWDEVMYQDHEGNITWVANCSHDYESASTMASCIHNNETVYTCKLCGDTYTEIFRYATGQHTFTDDKDTVCDVCGGKRDLNMPTTPMYRLYNKNSGEHFYTGSVQERDVLISVGWQYEGIAWNAPTKHGAPVYRLYNPNNGDHHYTMSAEERDMLVTVGWQYEGVAWNSASSSNIPMYRLYNPNADCGSHHYTGSIEERDMLVAVGWVYEGIGWYGLLN